MELAAGLIGLGGLLLGGWCFSLECRLRRLEQKSRKNSQAIEILAQRQAVIEENLAELRGGDE